MLARRARFALAVVIIASGGVHGAVGAPANGAAAPAGALRLEVPYVPQSGALCGGAALAMVLRYWGKPGVHAEDFSALVDPLREGIPTGDLLDAARARGWDATALTGSAVLARDLLAEGKPLIALVRTRSGNLHYLVLVGWNQRGFVVHDPQVGPDRTWDNDAFADAWSGGQYWTLLVLPPPATISAPPSTVAPASPSSPHLGRASELFRAGDWAGAAREAELALAAEPDDIGALRLLAGSRFLEGDSERALRAWNQLGEPRVDLLQVEGARRMRQSVLAAQLDLPPGRLLTPRIYRQARRRVGEVPALAASRLELQPRTGGVAQVDVALLERPLFNTGPLAAFAVAARAISSSEATLDLAGATGNGELCTAAWRWSRERRRVSLSLALPAPFGRPGLWSLSGFREEQAYRNDDGATESVSREERHRMELSWGDWAAADHPALEVRRQVSLALDTWVGRGSHFALGVSAQAHGLQDRLRLGVDGAGWASLRGDEPFAAVHLSLAWESNPPDARAAWLTNLGATSVTRASPLALWPGAGTGSGRAPLLRAHPLLDNGVIDSESFGRRLAHLTIERRTWIPSRYPAALGWAVFIDVASASTPGLNAPTGCFADAGLGLRLRLPGDLGSGRLDFAHGLGNSAHALSLAWTAPPY